MFQGRDNGRCHRFAEVGPLRREGAAPPVEPIQLQALLCARSRMASMNIRTEGMEARAAS